MINPSYWADQASPARQLLGAGPAGPIPDPTGKAPDPETMLIIFDPGYWSASPASCRRFSIARQLMTS